MVDVEKSGNGFGAGLLGDLSTQDAQRIVEQTKVAVDQAMDQASEFIRERPIVCLAGALALGYIIGKIVDMGETRVKVEGSDQEATEESFPTEYKEVQGTKQAMKFTVKRDGKLYLDHLGRLARKSRRKAVN